jgi:alpha-beta hydrolase superfamily lysophospholipase
VLWLPKNKSPKAVIQVAHGMMENRLQYESFAQEMIKNNIAVYANNHRGHGQTTQNLGDLGTKNGWQTMIADLREVTNLIKKTHPNCPVFLLGHSMGSYLAQDYATRYSNDLAGLLLSGTSFESPLLTGFAKTVAKLCSLLFGPKSTGNLLQKIVFFGFNAGFKSRKTNFDWLSRDEAYVKAYANSPTCGFVPNYNFFYELFNGLFNLYTTKTLSKIKKTLPIYIFYGDQDPLSQGGKKIEPLIKLYQKLGLKNIVIHSYSEGRHVMLNETNKDQVYLDILNWINLLLKQ